MLSLMSEIAHNHLLPVVLLTEHQARQGAASDLLHLFISCKKITCVEQTENTSSWEF